MEMIDKKYWWHPSGERKAVEFAPQTKCSYLELLPCPEGSTITPLQGSLDDASLEAWFEKVVTRKSITKVILVKRLTLQQDQSVQTMLIDEGQRSRLAGSRLRIL